MLNTAQGAWVRIPFAAVSATGAIAGVNLGFPARTHAIEFVTTGSPVTCNWQLEGTLDDVNNSPNWVNISTSQSGTTSPGLVFLADKPVTAIRINVTALSSGTIAFKYLGVQ